MLEKRNRHALKCVQIETQLVYANLEAFVYILSGLSSSQCTGSSDVSLQKKKEFLSDLFFLLKLLNIWKSFASKISQLGQNYINKSPTQRTSTIGLRKY